MKFSIGDKIILKRTGEEGVVSNYINKDMLEVEVDGTHFPVYADEVDHPYLKWFTEKSKPQKKQSPPEQLPLEKERDRQKRLPKGIYLSFMPAYKTNEMEDVVEQLKIYLINELPVPVRFSYEVKFFHQTDFIHEGALHEFGHLYLHSIDYADMNDQPRFHWTLADALHSEFNAEEGILRIKPSRLFDHINDLLQKNEPTFSYLLLEDFVPKAKQEKKEAEYPPPKIHAVKQSRPAKITRLADLPRYEVDLHIEELVEDRKGLSNAEMMKIQIDTLERFLHLAIMNRQDRIMIIHGLGTGALKEAVHQVLKTTPEVDRYFNEWNGKYGFGATEVRFKY